MSKPPESSEEPQQPSAFPPTRWTWIRQAQDKQEQVSELALNLLCAAYWYPLFVTARRKLGLGHHEAQDMVQGFWSDFLQKDTLGKVQPELGKFRSYLSACFTNFAKNEWRTQNAKKRGGDAIFISKDSEEWNAKCVSEMSHYASAEAHLDHAWKNASVEAAFREVEASWARRGKGQIFEAIKNHLKEGGERGAYKAMAEQFGLSEANLRQNVSQLRKELREARDRWLGKET